MESYDVELNERELLMNRIKRFERTVGGRWTGLIFHRDHVPNQSIADRSMRFCEAIKLSNTGPITLTKDLLDCPGARRSFGWVTNEDDKLVKKMAEKNGMKEETAKKLIKKIPHLEDRISAITVGTYESPDIILSYTQPEAAMRLVYQWQKIFGVNLDVIISSVMAVCGNVVAGAHISNKICLSFGCPESRNHGAIGSDRLIIGLPAHLIDENFFIPKPDNIQQTA